jgi:type II secretory pathway component GspD/PulD (secretin)
MRSGIAAAALVVAILVGFAHGVPASGTARVTGIEVREAGTVAEVVVLLSGSTSHRVFSFTEQGIPKVVVDIYPARLALGVPSSVNADVRPLVRVRAGQFKEDTVRVVLDLERPVDVLVRKVSGAIVAAVPLDRTAAGERKAGEQSASVPGLVPVPNWEFLEAPRSRWSAAQEAQEIPASQPSGSEPGTASQAAAPAPAGDADRKKTPSGKVTLEMRDASLADVLVAIGRICGWNVVTDASVKGDTTIRLVDVPCVQALDLVLNPNNLGYVRFGVNVIVMAKDKLTPPPESPETVFYRLDFGDAEQVKAALASAVPEAKVSVDKRTNTLVVTATRRQQEEVVRVLRALDVRIPQVMIEARVVDISQTALDQLGLQWGFTAGPHLQVVGEGGTNRVTFGIAPGPVLQAALNALVTQGKARVLAAPRVSVVDGNRASVALGDEVPIPQIDTSGRVTFTFKSVGVNLTITPRVNRDGLITAQITPEVSRIVEFLSTPSGPVPRIGTRKVDTTVTVKDGDSIVIAGLISEEERRTTVKVPLLGDIPVIGSLFRFTTQDVRKSEVIFIITPRIVSEEAR